MKSWCTTISQFSECCIFYLYHSCFFIFTSNNHLSCTLCIFYSSIVSSINNASSLFSKPSAFVVCFLTNINVILTFPSVVVFHFWGHATKTQENDDEEKKQENCAAENSTCVLWMGRSVGHRMRSAGQKVISCKSVHFSLWKRIPLLMTVRLFT